MKIAVLYLCVTGGKVTADYAARFAATYHDFPADAEHELIVICNGGPLSLHHSLLFASLKAKFIPRVNDPGWDISAYIDLARTHCGTYDAILCLGESVYFHRRGWLKRLAEVWIGNGPGLYGLFSSNLIRGHLNTTAFFCPPRALEWYPRPVQNKEQRYEFEHGRAAWWKVVSRKLPVRLVTWDGVWAPMDWRKPANILWRGDQSNCLCWMSHCDRWRDADAAKQTTWARNADASFK